MDNRNPTNLTWQSQHTFVFLDVVVFQAVFICLSRDCDLTVGLFSLIVHLSNGQYLQTLTQMIFFVFLNIQKILIPLLLDSPFSLFTSSTCIDIPDTGFSLSTAWELSGCRGHTSFLSLPRYLAQHLTQMLSEC